MMIPITVNRLQAAANKAIEDGNTQEIIYEIVRLCDLYKSISNEIFMHPADLDLLIDYL